MTLILLRRFWPYLLAGVVAVALCVSLALTRSKLTHARESLAAEQKAHAADIASWKAATTAAQAADKAHAAQVAQQYTQISQETQDALTDKLQDARTQLADYARRMRANAQAADNHGSGSAAGVPEASGAAEVADGSGADTLIPTSRSDLEICTENSVKAQGWQDWYKQVSAVQ